MLARIRQLFNWENPQVSLSSLMEDETWTPRKTISVTEATALSLPALFQGVRLVSGTISRLPIDIFQRQSNGGRIKAKDHPSYRLLRWQPSQHYHAQTWLEALIKSAILTGNGYSLIVRDRLSYEPSELLIADSGDVRRINGQTVYTLTVDGKTKDYSAPDVIHIRNLSTNDGLKGHGVVSVLREALYLSLAERRAASRYFAADMRSRTVYKPPAHLRDEVTLEAQRRNLKAVHQGDPSEPFIAPAGWECEYPQFSAEDAQLLQSRSFSLVEIANAIGIPPSFLGATTNTSYGSLEADRQYLMMLLERWLYQIEIECSLKLLRTDELDDFYCEFNRQAIERNNTTATIDNLNKLVGSGILQTNEARQDLNLPAIQEPKPEEPQEANDPDRKTTG